MPSSHQIPNKPNLSQAILSMLCCILDPLLFHINTLLLTSESAGTTPSTLTQAISTEGTAVPPSTAESIPTEVTATAALETTPEAATGTTTQLTQPESIATTGTTETVEPFQSSELPQTQTASTESVTPGKKLPTTPIYYHQHFASSHSNQTILAQFPS